MLDVHPPHAPTHTWKDFFVHIATITIGLLIAIGLEQTVEFFHHRSERHELEHDLVEEARNNLAIIKLDYDYFDRIEPMLIALRSDAAERKAHPTVSRPPVEIAALFNNGHFYFLDAPVWNTAKEGALIVLLPRHESAAYDLVYTQQGLMTAAFHRYYQSRSALSNFYLRFTALPRQPPNLDHIAPEDLHEYATLLADLEGELDLFRSMTNLARDVTQPAAEGNLDDQKAFQQLGITERH